MAMGTVKPPNGGLGYEAAGTVTRVGSHVQDLLPGDRVISIGSGSCATTVVVPTSRCIKIPDNLLIDDAASMPVAFSTAIHTIIDVGNLKESDVRIFFQALSLADQAYRIF